jgi:hypothetical protein
MGLEEHFKVDKELDMVDMYMEVTIWKDQTIRNRYEYGMNLSAHPRVFRNIKWPRKYKIDYDGPGNYPSPLDVVELSVVFKMDGSREYTNDEINEFEKLMSWINIVELLKYEARIQEGTQEVSDNPLAHMGIMGQGFNMHKVTPQESTHDENQDGGYGDDDEFMMETEISGDDDNEHNHEHVKTLKEDNLLTSPRKLRATRQRELRNTNFQSTILAQTRKSKPQQVPSQSRLLYVSWNPRLVAQVIVAAAAKAEYPAVCEKRIPSKDNGEFRTIDGLEAELIQLTCDHVDRREVTKWAKAYAPDAKESSNLKVSKSRVTKVQVLKLQDSKIKDQDAISTFKPPQPLQPRSLDVELLHPQINTATLEESETPRPQDSAVQGLGVKNSSTIDKEISRLADAIYEASKCRKYPGKCKKIVASHWKAWRGRTRGRPKGRGELKSSINLLKEGERRELMKWAIEYEGQ